MNRLEGLPFYDFSWKNKYASNYNVAYKRAVRAQNELVEAKHSPHVTAAEVEKWKQDLKTQKAKVEDYSILARSEENTLKGQKKDGVGMNIDFMA